MISTSSSGAFNSWNLLLPRQISDSSRPKGIVVLIGWWGAKPRHLEKYVELYHRDDENQSSCITLSGIVDSRTIATKDDRILRAFAYRGLAEISCLLEKHEDLPVVVHIFSNGGGFVWEHMIQILKQEGQQQQNNQETTQNPNLYLIRKNMKGQIFDSAPAYLSVDCFIRALEASGTIRNRFLLKIVEITVSFVQQIEKIVCSVFGKESRRVAYWNTLLNTNESFSRKNAFIYGSMDHVTDMIRLEKFIECRKKMQGTEVSVLKFDDSVHVLHYRNHPEEYKEFVWKFVDEINKKS